MQFMLFIWQNEVERNITLLQEKEGEMKALISKMENRESVDIDDAVVPTTPLYKQYVFISTLCC